ncbi:MAG: SDR family oxidoreductase [Deltaproteobacteria bacterium]|nr:SDR family oxidoreductase [Deltaproteobacteria bacterium]
MAEKKTVVVAGATGRAGGLIAAEALARGYRVRALLIKPFDGPDQPDLTAAGMELVEGDLASVTSLESALDGAHFLISAIGSRKPFSARENNRIDNMGNQNLARAAQTKGLERVVVISSIGVGDSAGVISFMNKLFMGPILKAKGKSEAFIASSGMAYTIIRPGGYSQKELSGDIAYGEGGKFSGLIRREQIARACVDALENQAMKNRTFEVIDAATVRGGGSDCFVKF